MARAGDQTAVPAAPGAGPYAAQRGGVAGLADRSLGPAGGWCAILAAMRRAAPARGAQLTQTGSGPVANEHGRSQPQRLDVPLGHPVAGIADAGQPVMGASGDPPGPPAPCAGPLWPVRAAGTHRPMLLVATGHGLTTPHREHAMASWRLRHREHIPPELVRVSGLPVAAQIEQVGSGSTAPAHAAR